MRRPAHHLIGLLAISLLLAGSLLAIEPPARDPVESAFALPRGMVLTAKEIEWANQLRAQLEPKLRDAIQRVQEATDKSEKVKAAKEAAQVRAQIKMAINTIIQRRAMIAAQAYAKKVAEMRKKAAAKRKKAAAKKRHRGGKGKKHRKKKKR